MISLSRTLSSQIEPGLTSQPHRVMGFGPLGWASFKHQHCLILNAPSQTTSYLYPRRFGYKRATVSAVHRYGEQWYTPEDCYLCLGVAHCFERDDEGKLVDRMVIEPITPNSLESMSHGAKTSFLHVYGLLLGDALQKNVFEHLPNEFKGAIMCENYDARCNSCARTWMRPHAVDNLMDLVPLGKVRSDFNYDLSDKRVLNFENEVKDEDNIKQDMSIDVYGRKQEQKNMEPTSHEDGNQSGDELDTLLAM